jgi:CRISPR-associated exonuclease Cas4
LFFLLCSTYSYKASRKKKKEFRIPKGKIIYTDLNKPVHSLFSKRLQITGKPDFIIKEKNYFIPVEIKSGVHDKPLNNHVYQLASYCHLVEENEGGLVPYGRLIYEDSDFVIPFNPKTRFELESILTNMRKLLRQKIVQPNHNEPKKCYCCSMKKYCPSSFAKNEK